MSHEWYCRCRRCGDDLERELTILGLAPSPESPDEQHERLVQEHQASVVTPALKERL